MLQLTRYIYLPLLHVWTLSFYTTTMYGQHTAPVQEEPHHSKEYLSLTTYEKECVATLVKDPIFLKSVNLDISFMRMIAERHVHIEGGFKNAVHEQIKNDMSSEEVRSILDKNVVGGENIFKYFNDQARLTSLYSKKYPFLADSVNSITRVRIYEGALRVSDKHTEEAIDVLHEASTHAKNREGYCYQEWLNSFNEERYNFYKLAHYHNMKKIPLSIQRLCFAISNHQSRMDLRNEAHETCSRLPQLYKWIDSSQKK